MYSDDLPLEDNWLVLGSSLRCSSLVCGVGLVLWWFGWSLGDLALFSRVGGLVATMFEYCAYSSVLLRVQ